MAGESEESFLDQIDQRIVLIDNQIQAVKGKLTTTARGLVLNGVLVGGLILVALLLFLARNEYREGVENNRQHSDSLLCEAANDNRQQVNAKFAQLAQLFDLAMAQGEDEALPPPLAAAYENWKRPVPLLDCEHIVNGEESLEFGGGRT